MSVSFTLSSGPITMRSDLPGDTDRLFAEAEGIAEVWVNGTSVVADGTPTGAVPGTLLRAGTDTHTPNFG